MANYTQSIREILQFNKLPNESLENVADVYAIANRSLFDHMPANVISGDYLEQFITGFALHFMNEELGYETLPLWKIALNEKIYNNGTYINDIFANLDKQIFADYRVKQSSNYGTRSGSRNVSGTLSSQRDIGTLASENTSDNLMSTDETSASDTLSIMGTTETTKEGSELRSKAGEDTLTKAGSETRLKDGEDVLTKEGAEVRHKGGSDTTEKRGSEATSNTGTDTTTDNGTQRTVRSGATVNTANGLQMQSDTPMGSLQNLRTPGGDPSTYTKSTITGDLDFENYAASDANAGYGYSDGQTYNYMSAAAESSQTSTNVDNNNENTFNGNVNEIEHGLVATTTYGVDDDPREDETTYNSKEDVVYGQNLAGNTAERKDTTEYGGKEELAYGKDLDGNVSARTDTTEYGNKEALTYGKGLNAQGQEVADARTDTESVSRSELKGVSSTLSKTSTDVVTKSSTTATDDDLSQSTQEAATTSDSHADTEDVTDYTLNWEMLYRSMPLLNKVWEIFDDLFMIIF